MNNVEIDLELITKNFNKELAKVGDDLKKFESSVNGNLTGIQKEMDGLSKTVNSTGKRISSSFGSASIAVGSFFGSLASNTVSKFASGISQGVAGLTSFAKESIQASIASEETRSKFATVFKELGDGAEDAADRLATAYGLTGTKSRELLGDTGDLLTGFGFSGEAALKLSEDVQGLAVDLASFTNFSGGAEGASQALTKALLGETESLKSLGIAINQEAVKKQVAVNASNGLTFATERQAKAQATLDLALKQSGNAIGDYARTSQSTANQTRLFQTRLTDLKEAVGSELKPVFSSILIDLNKFIGALDVTQITNFVKQGIVFVIDGFKQLVTFINPVINGFKLIGNTFTLVLNVLRTATSGIISIFAGLASDITATVNAIFSVIPDALIPDGWKQSMDNAAIATASFKDATIKTTQEMAANTKSSLLDVGNSFNNIIPESAIGLVQAKAEQIKQIVIATNTAQVDDEVAKNAKLDALQAERAAKELEQIAAQEQAKRELRASIAEENDKFEVDLELVRLNNKIVKFDEDLIRLNEFELKKIELIRQSELQKATLIADNDKKILENQKINNKAYLAAEASRVKLTEELTKRENKRKNDTVIGNKKANDKKLDDDKKAHDQTVAATKQFLSIGEQLTKDNAKANKAFQVANAIVNTYSAANAALASSPPPVSYALAAATIAAGIANVSKITSAGNFANGGFVGGGSFTGDRLTANVNSGEAILNSQQQKNFMKLANGATSTIGGSNMIDAINSLGDRIATMEIVITANDTEIARSVSRGVQDGIVIGESI